MLSPQSLAEIERELAKYPPDQMQSATMPALRIAQDQERWLSPALIEEVAELLGIPAVRALEVASFYSMYELEPVGEIKIGVCTNISCMLRGSGEVVEYLEQKLGVKMGGTTDDGRFTLKEVECLGACGGAPMLQLDRAYHENLTPDKIDSILEPVE
ncbi:MAG: NAD(P)H-dependent oxidoreductase subunit E [Pseudomonadota bacterium]|nr:NAD(P)H-dependent oxidoreductase subunit E [Pseudomonadota bacterium]